MTTLLILVTWCFLSVVVGLVVGPLLGRMSDLYPPAPPEEEERVRLRAEELKKQQVEALEAARLRAKKAEDALNGLPAQEQLAGSEKCEAYLRGWVRGNQQMKEAEHEDARG
jgi:hypothetical protein